MADKKATRRTPPNSDPVGRKFHGSFIEYVPTYKMGDGKYINHANSHIILERDRPNTRGSGYSEQDGASAIDIVVGLQGVEPSALSAVDKNMGSSTVNRPGDSARIYISQKCDIDDYFGLPEGEMTNDISAGTSGIAIKADNVRLIARKGIKIVTGTQAPETILGNGQKSSVQVGVELMSRGGLTKGQPMVLGGNLLNCLEEMVEIDTSTNEDLKSLGNIVSNLISIVSNLATIVSAVPGGAPASSLTPICSFLLTNIQMLDFGIKDRIMNENFGVKSLKRKYLVPEIRLSLIGPDSKELGDDDAVGAFPITSKYHRLD